MKKNILKKLLSVGVALTVSTSCFAASGLNIIGSAQEAAYDTEEHGLGFIEPENEKLFDPDSVDSSVYNADYPVKFLSPYAPVVGSGVSDAVYDSKEHVTPVRDQGREGVCWAFAATADYESEILSKLNMTAEQYPELDLSENHLRYATSTDGGNSESPVKRGYNSGGNTKYAVAYYISSIKGLNGPIWEADDPYKDYDKRDVSKTKSKTNRVGYYLTRYSDYGEIKPLTDGADKLNVFKAAIKNEIMDSGAVCFSFRSEGSDSDLFKNNVETYGTTFYSPSEKVSDHGVVAVGWNDNVPKTAFANTPPGDGAWLCKNSWDTDWGKDGYFWMSYYTTIGADSISGIIKDEELYDNIYGYDNYWQISGFGYTGKTFAYNKYTISGGATELLNGLGTYLPNASAHYKFYISESGEPSGFHEVNVTFPDDEAMSQKDPDGYYSADKWGWRVAKLDSPVVVTGDFLVGVEVIADDNDKLAGCATVPSTLKNVSYYASSVENAKKGNVEDLKSKTYVAVIKAYTLNKRPAEIAYTADQSKTLKFDYNDASTKTRSFDITANVVKNEDDIPIKPGAFYFSSASDKIAAVGGMKVSNVTENGSTLTLTVEVENSVQSKDYYLVYSGKIVNDGDSSPSIKKIAYTRTEGFVETIIDNGAFSYRGDNPILTVLTSYNNTPVTSIADNGMKGNDKIEDVTLTSGITSIGSKAFANCTSLRYVTIPDTVTTIASDAFEGCDLERLLIVCSEELAKKLPNNIKHAESKVKVSNEYYLYGGQTVKISYNTKEVIIDGESKGVFKGADKLTNGFKWVVEKSDGKTPSDVKFVYLNNKGKKVTSSSVAKPSAEVTTKAVTKFNSYVILKAVSSNYSYKNKTGSVYAEVSLYINPLSVSGYKELKAADTFEFNTKKGVGFKKSDNGDNTYELTMYEGRSFTLPFKAKDGAYKTLLYQLSGENRGVTVLNGKVTAYNAVTGQQIKIFPLFKAAECPVITVNVTVTAMPKSLKSNTASVSLASGITQQICVSAAPASTGTADYTFEFNTSKFTVKADGSEVDGSGKTSYSFNSGMLLDISLKEGATLGAKDKETLKVSCKDIKKPLSISLKAAVTMVNVTGFKESYKKVGKDGFTEINVPRGGAFDLGVAVNPATAVSKFTWTVGNKVDDDNTVSGEVEDEKLSIKGCIISAGATGTYYAQAETVGENAKGEKVSSRIYKINVYDPSGSLFFQHPEVTDYYVAENKATLQLEYDKRYMIKNGMLMPVGNALGDCDYYFTVGDEIEIELPMGENGCTEPIEWKSSKQTALRVTAGNESGIIGSLYIKALSPGSYTVTGTTKNTKQKISFKVAVKKPDNADDASLKESEADQGFASRNSSGIWEKASSLTVKAGEEIPVTLFGGASGKVSFKVNDGGYASVNASSGIIKGKKTGKTTLTATVSYGKAGSNTLTIPLEVTAADPVYKKITVPVCAKKNTEFSLSVKGSNIDAAKLMWYFCKWNGTAYGDETKLTDAGVKKATISETGIYKVYPKMSDGTGNGESMARTIGIYDTLVTKVSMNATAAAKAKLAELKKDVAQGTTLYLPIFANEGADVSDITWSTSNSYLATAAECKAEDIPDSEFKTANKDAYSWVKIETDKTKLFTGKVTLTGVFRNSGKKVSVSFKVIA